MSLFRKLIPLLLSSITCNFLLAQECDLTIELQVIDELPNQVLEFANVQIKGTSVGAISNNKGVVILNNLCPGEYDLLISHLACETKEIHLTLLTDTAFKIYMPHTDHFLEAVHLHGEQVEIQETSSVQIKTSDIQDNADRNFATVLEELSGVTTLKNGSGIAKPVVNGLYGNRLSILNNGVAQSGQQWGNDHSPEIDPLVANEITVIKGGRALEYFGANQGAVVLLEAGRIARKNQLKGNANYFFSSNGLGHGLNFRLEKGSPSFAWRVNASLKKSGDHKTADYFLNNTGGQEANLSIQLEKEFGSKWQSSLYLSSFNAELGVLRGSHIGNLSDLESALQNEIPFFTEEKFSYQLESPRQQVHHQLGKLKLLYFLHDKASLEFNAAGQWNLRKEFDVRRSGRSQIAALNLSQVTTFLEAKYSHVFKKDWHFRSGVQFNLTDNTNNPETGILPLIPDYISYQTGVFAIVDKPVGKSFFEYAIRYDNTIQKVAAISQTAPREIVRYANNFNNVSSTFSWQHRFSDAFSLELNTAYAMRNPGINELYSVGLHQGVSGIEEGNENLQIEKSWKSTFGFKTKTKKVFSFESLVYYQNVQDYIYLQPQEEIRLTIRGAFPVFAYEQINAQIYGLDLTSRLQFTKALKANLIYNFIRGRDLTQSLPLINLPSNQIYGKLSYTFDHIELGKRELENTQIEVNNRFVFEQKNILPEQDFLAPPPGYNLLGLKLSTDLEGKKLRYRFLVRVDNVLNVSYRDYLNRQRYFSDDQGVNVTVGVKVGF